MKVISPWNEANHRSQPTFKNPKRAAQYYNVVRKYCRGCKIIAADVIDETNMERWLKVFKKTAKKPKIWGLHNYRDTNKRKGQLLGGTKRLLKAVKGDVWLTETGGIVKFVLPNGHTLFPFSESRANSATKRMFALAKRYRSRIKRLYIYHWQQSPSDNRFDAGLLRTDGTARPAYNTVRRAARHGRVQPVVDSRRERLARARLYFVTDVRPGLEELLAAALAGGVDMVQLRDKEASDDELVRAAAVFRRLCDEHGALFWLNDRPDLVEACAADGVHVGQDDMPAREARALVGDEVLVGLSTHSPEQLDDALASGVADQLSVGPVWETPTKAGRPAAGLSYVRHAAEVAGERPWFAIGGIDLGNVREVTQAGASRIVVVRAIRDAADPGGGGERAPRRARGEHGWRRVVSGRRSVAALPRRAGRRRRSRSPGTAHRRRLRAALRHARPRRRARAATRAAARRTRPPAPL